MIETLLGNLERWLFEPPESIYGQPLWKLTRILRYPYALIRDILRGDLTLRAMSLVYTTLLSIVPLIAVSFSVLKGLGYHRELEPVLYTFLEPLGDRGYELTQQITSFVDNVRGDVLGSLGLMFLLYTTLSMIQKVEESFNFVWRVEQPRSLMRRVSEYLSVMVVGPALIVAALGLIATFAHTTAVQALAKYEPFGTMLVAFGRLTPYVLVTGVFTFLYAFMPNTKVQFRAALIGGLFAGVRVGGDGDDLHLVRRRVDAHDRDLRQLRHRDRRAHLAARLVADSPAGRAAVVLRAEPAIPAAGPRRDPAQRQPARARRAVDHVPDRERLPGCESSLDHQPSRRAPGPAGRRPQSDRHRAGARQAAPAVRGRDLGAGARPADDRARRGAGSSEARHGGPRLGRIRDVAPAVAAARAAEEAMAKSLKGKTVSDLVEKESG